MTKQQVHAIRLAVDLLALDMELAAKNFNTVRNSVRDRFKDLRQICDHKLPDGSTAMYGHCTICELSDEAHERLRV